jgi:hypothetical protein
MRLMISEQHSVHYYECLLRCCQIKWHLRVVRLPSCCANDIIGASNIVIGTTSTYCRCQFITR